MAELTIPIVVNWDDIKDRMAEGNIVEVTRCKDCKYRQEHHYEDDGEEPYIKLTCSNRFGLNGKEAYMIYDYDFCSRAERKE